MAHMRRFPFGVLSLALVALVLSSPSPVRAQAKGPIKIGVLLPLTGVFTPNGREALDGFKMYIDEVESKVAGRTIELIVEDTEGKPDVGLTKARKLVERDQVQMLTGIVNTAVAIAVQGYVREKKIPLIISADAGANALTMPGKLLNPYVFRISQSASTPGNAAADWGYKNGWRKVVTVTADYAGGLEVTGGFARTFCQLGGRVFQELYPPLGNPDFAPYLAQVDRSADAVAIFLPGADGLRFGRQYNEYGLKGKLPLMDMYGQVTFESNLPQLGEAALGVYSTIHYAAAVDTPENKRFVAAFKARTNRVPFDNGPDGYAGARAIVEAAKAVQGNVEDAERFMAALKKVDFESPKGRIRLDQYNNVIQNMYVRRVDRVGGELVNVPIQTYPSISQFWTWTPEEYMKYTPYAELKGKMTDCGKVLERK